MQQQMIRAILEGLETRIAPLALGKVTSLWVMNFYDPKHQIYFQTEAHPLIELVFRQTPGTSPATLEIEQGSLSPIVRIWDETATHPLYDLGKALVRLTNYSGPHDDFKARFTYLAIQKDPQTNTCSGRIDVKNLLTGQTYPLKTGDNVSKETLNALLDTLILTYPRLKPDMASQCVDAINERLQTSKRRVVTVQIIAGSEVVRVLDSQGNWWDDLTIFTTPAGLAEAFIRAESTGS